jgi:hypothetical protein
MTFSVIDASKIRSSVDGNTWSLVDPNPAQAHLLEHGVSQVPFERLSYEHFMDKVTRFSPLFAGVPGQADWVTAWRFHQLGIAGFEMIYNELRNRENRSFRLNDPDETNNPIWAVISNRRFELEGGDPLSRHLPTG